MHEAKKIVLFLLPFSPAFSCIAYTYFTSRLWDFYCLYLLKRVLWLRVISNNDSLSLQESATPLPHKPLFSQMLGVYTVRQSISISIAAFPLPPLNILFFHSTLVNHWSNSLFLWTEFVTIQVLWLLPVVLQFISDLKHFLFSRLNVKEIISHVLFQRLHC